MNFHTRPEWQNVEVQSVNRLPAHSPWSNTHTLSLDGVWRFLLCEHPSQLPPGFYLQDFNDDRWEDISVPGNWELSGHSYPVYTNWVYPFTDEPGAHLITPSYERDTDYSSHMNPPNLPDKIPTGLYRRSFTLPEHFIGKKLILSFGGVESGFYAWINGNPVGYSQDSKLAAEFDVTRYVYAGENNITVQVMRFTDATWIEDQDYWHLSGIFRSVSLMAKPRMHIEDVFVTAEADGTFRADVSVTRLSGFADMRMRLHIYNPEGDIIYKCKMPLRAEPSYFDNGAPDPGHTRFATKLNGITPWTPETPVIYSFHLALLDCNDEACDREYVKFGFRTVRIENGVFTLNGRRFLFRGVNRHEHSPDGGRTVSRERMVKEIELMKKMNVNAVRTCHYPDDPYWYELCDEYGIAVVCETNLETHGVRGMLSNDPEWAEAYLQRARRMAQIHKNHPSIFIWSLGNESGWGPNHAAMAAWLRAYDPSRPVQYESGAPGKAISDIRCPMYPTYDKVVSMLTDGADIRPVILCEYAYQIMNSGGGMEKFRTLTERYERFQGGFIWDFADKALYMDIGDEKRAPGYGGDFFEPVTDPESPVFMCLNGIVTCDLTVKPAGIEAAAVYAPVFLTRIDGNRFTVNNRMCARRTEGYALKWSILSQGDNVLTGEMTLPDVAPMENGEIEIPIPETLLPDSFLTVSINDRFLQQFPLLCPQPILRRQKYVPASFDDSHGMITVIGQGFSLTLSKTNGNIMDIVKGEVSYAVSALSECASRGLSGADAQAGWGLFETWSAFSRENSTRKLLHVSASHLSDGRVQITRLTRLDSDTVSGASIDVELTLRVAGDGLVALCVRYLAGGIASVPRLGVTWVLPDAFERVEWYGRGPGENYRDRTLSAPVGIYAANVTDMHFPFTPPSENGGREETRWVSFSRADGRAMTVRALSPFHFDAHHYTESDLRDTMHDHELIRRNETVVHLDAAHAGIGGDMAWSTVMGAGDALKPGEYIFTAEIQFS